MQVYPGHLIDSSSTVKKEKVRVRAGGNERPMQDKLTIREMPPAAYVLRTPVYLIT
jgi:hypothetical protein